MSVDRSGQIDRSEIAWIGAWCSIAALHVALVVLFVYAPQSLAFAIVAVLAILVWACSEGVALRANVLE